jgi:hypothetical protein
VGEVGRVCGRAEALGGGMEHLRLALTISVRHGRPRIMMPLPSSTAAWASLSFCLRLAPVKLP